MSRKKKNEQGTGLEPGGGFAPSRLRPIDIQQQEFSTSFRGYEPTEVDAFLDRITEDFAALHEENKRLKEGGPLMPPSGAAGADAEAVLRQARAQADAILDEARNRAAVIGSSAGGPTPEGSPLAAVWPFLAKEREFLRSLAASVQEHAEGVKRQAKQIQEASKQSAPAAVASKAEPAPAPRAAPSPVAKPAAPATSPPARPTPAPTESAWTQTADVSASPVVRIPPTPVDTPSSTPGPADKGGEGSGDEPTLRELFWNDEK